MITIACDVFHFVLCWVKIIYSLVPIRRHVPINRHTSRHWKSHTPIKRHTYKGLYNRCNFVFIKGAPRSASKLSTDPIKRHGSYFLKCTGSNKRTVPNNRTVSCNWNQRVRIYKVKSLSLVIPWKARFPWQYKQGLKVTLNFPFVHKFTLMNSSEETQII